MATFKLKSKPIKPVRQTKISQSCDLYDGITISEILDRLPTPIPEDAQLTLAGHLDYTDIEVHWTEPESDEAWEARLITYKTRLAIYEKWYAANRTTVEKRLAERAAAEREQELKRQQQERKALEKEVKSSLAKLEKMKKMDLL